jgi:hypothetical protein
MSDPTICRMVHYVARGSADGKFPPVCRAAVITDVDAAHVSLAVLNPTGIFFGTDIAEDQNGKAPGTWHWPEMV